MASVDADAPTRTVETQWRTLHARCDHPHLVEFRSWLGPAEPATLDQLVSLTIRGDAFWLNATLSRAPVPPAERAGRRYLDPTWHVDREFPWSLRRAFSHGDTADPVVVSFGRTHLMPAVVRWLTTDPEAAKLLDEGETHWRDSCLSDSEEAEQRLHRAVARIIELREIVASGHVVSGDHERFLRHADARVEPDGIDDRR